MRALCFRNAWRAFVHVAALDVSGALRSQRQRDSVYGHALAEKDPGTGIEYRRTNGTNARGQATQETFGNGVILTPTYQLQTGQLTGLTYSGAGGTLRQLGYGYDVFGNLKRQTPLRQPLHRYGSRRRASVIFVSYRKSA